MAFHILIAVFAVFASISAASASDVGVRSSTAFAPERGEEFDYLMWYPATDGGTPISVGENGLFYGTPAQENADFVDGQLPLVLISHGAGGNAAQYGWIASELVQAGYIVMAPNHPGSTSRNSSAVEAVKLWKRPADLSALLAAIENDPALHQHIDIDTVGVLGFSAGGYTALAIGGAKIDQHALKNFCDGAETGMSDCAFLARANINLHELDLTPASRSNLDQRVDAIIAVDPGVVQTLTQQSLEKITVPVSIINLGQPGKIPPAVFAKESANHIPGATYTSIADAIHFSFLPECKPNGPAILLEEGELDPLCDDGGDRSRAQIHAQLVELITGFFARTLQSDR